MNREAIVQGYLIEYMIYTRSIPVSVEY